MTHNETARDEFPCHSWCFPGNCSGWLLIRSLGATFLFKSAKCFILKAAARNSCPFSEFFTNLWSDHHHMYYKSAYLGINKKVTVDRVKDEEEQQVEELE